MPAAPSLHAYELWLIGPAGARPAGLLDGSSDPSLTPPLTDTTHIGLTIGPAGGSPAPCEPALLPRSGRLSGIDALFTIACPPVGMRDEESCPRCAGGGASGTRERGWVAGRSACG
ncbi:anti-sigma factor [Actinocorallia aurea]